MTSVLWYKRDLRIHDHPALAHAAERGDVVPLYIIEPDYWALSDTSGRQYAFLCESLASLRDALRALGSDLVIRVGDAVDVMQKLHDEIAFAHLVSHEETGNGWTYVRDRCVAEWARANGVDWTELPQSGVVRRLDTRDRWAARRNRFLAQPQTDVPRALRPVSSASDPIPDLCVPDPCPDRQSGGREHGLSLLGGFLTERGQTYRKDMSSPLEGAIACSRLSPHLAYGTVSVREVSQGCAARQREVRGGPRDGWAGSLKSFQSRLAWRDHFMQKLEDEPELEHRCLHRAYEGMRPLEPDSARLAAWEKGETGLPFLDACMRSLQATGWLNFRMRAMVTAVASYHLWLDWRSTGQHLARMFTDYEAGIHWSQMQMQSGTTGINTPRIYNPIKQGLDQDPTGAFTRRWVPELAAVPDEHLQTPWTWDGARRVLGKTYPEPIIDVAEAARTARTRYFAHRRTVDRDETQRVIRKHASRKDSAGHFVNDRSPRKQRRAPTSDAQLTLDL
ncbi:FAD-binding domain-containing protein [Marivita hallyeonensis]|uniref:Deoxyribodipyrimidine photo-lyase family protein (Cryptochrome) n=1 Tax=Marivita hallyeonensis TaxID=996342 RepID=A0A1M5W2E9_9RHOB|nr:FAD-binding domain-containing protein [Marivita hallyeonensis]SHH81383.1 deoxyribodipyrimidine photo-lyase family protein (cryptochrome) [Marivita hallyeonensis]